MGWQFSNLPSIFRWRERCHFTHTGSWTGDVYICVLGDRHLGNHRLYEATAQEQRLLKEDE